MLSSTSSAPLAPLSEAPVFLKMYANSTVIISIIIIKREDYSGVKRKRFNDTVHN